MMVKSGVPSPSPDLDAFFRAGLSVTGMLFCLPRWMMLFLRMSRTSSSTRCSNFGVAMWWVCLSVRLGVY